MGLLMGASVLSICEIFDLFIYNSIRKCWNLRSSRDQVSPVQNSASRRSSARLEDSFTRNETFMSDVDSCRDIPSVCSKTSDAWLL